MSKDPILFNGGDLNMYGYTLLDPIRYIDRNGLNPEKLSKAYDQVADQMIRDYYIPQKDRVDWASFPDEAKRGSLYIGPDGKAYIYI